MKYKKIGIIFLACLITIPTSRVQAEPSAFIAVGWVGIFIGFYTALIGFVSGGIASGIVLHNKAKKDAQRQTKIQASRASCSSRIARNKNRRRANRCQPLEIPMKVAA